jgi:hypothetical protein
MKPLFGFSENTTGIPGVVFWLAQETEGTPTVRVSNLRGKLYYNSEDCFAVSIPTDHKFSPVVVYGSSVLPAFVLKRVIAFVHHNRHELMGIWAGSVLPDEVAFTKV